MNSGRETLGIYLANGRKTSTATASNAPAALKKVAHGIGPLRKQRKDLAHNGLLLVFILRRGLGVEEGKVSRRHRFFHRRETSHKLMRARRDSAAEALLADGFLPTAHAPGAHST